MKYSKSTGCFYFPNKSYTELPDDLIDVADAEYQAALAAREWGGALIVKNGKLKIIPPVQPGIEQLRAVATAKINSWRDQQERGTVMYNGIEFDADQSARERIIPVVMVGVMPLEFWTDAHNVDQPMTIQDMQGLLGAILAQGGRIHARQRQMKEAVATMNETELAAFVPGWDKE